MLRICIFAVIAVSWAEARHPIGAATVECGQSYDFEIQTRRTKWNPVLNIDTDDTTVTLHTCNHQGNIGDTKLYKANDRAWGGPSNQICHNDDHGSNSRWDRSSGGIAGTRQHEGGNCGSVGPLHRGLDSFCTGTVDQGSYTLKVGGWSTKTGTATLTVECSVPPTKSPTNEPTKAPTIEPTKEPTLTPCVTTTTATVECGNSYEYTICNSGDRWEPELTIGSQHKVTLHTCGHRDEALSEQVLASDLASRMQDTKIYRASDQAHENICHNDDHRYSFATDTEDSGCSSDSNAQGTDSFCTGTVHEGSYNLNVGGWSGKTGTATLVVQCEEKCSVTCDVDATSGVLTTHHDTATGHAFHRCYHDDSISSTHCACDCKNTAF